MARLDYYKLPGELGQGFFLDVQTDMLDYLRTRIVIPLRPLALTPKPIRELNPVLEVNGQAHVMVTQSIASIPARELRRVAGSLQASHDVITRALDLLLVGF